MSNVMRHTNSTPSSAPRYFRATLVTALTVALLPAGLLWLSYSAYMSPNWEPLGDSGAVQGFAFLGVASAVTIGFVVIAFPMAARFLHTRGEFTTVRFIKVLAVWLASLSALFGFSLGGVLGSLTACFTIGLMLFFIVGLLALPFSPLWFKLAQ